MAPVPATPEKLTYADYENFPEDGHRHEVLAGEHVVTPPPNVRHQEVVTNLVVLLGRWSKEAGDEALEKAEEVWNRAGALLTSPILPELELPVQEVFE